MEVADLIAAGEERWREAWREGPQRLRLEQRQPGEAAPDLELQDSTGATRRLSEFWADRPALLLFWRHYGCTCGFERAALLRREHDAYVGAGASVVVIGQAEPERSARYAYEYAIPCPVLCDPERVAYEAYGLPDGLPAQVLYDAPENLLRGDYEAGLELGRARAAAGRPLVDNPWQLPGEFVVDRGGAIRLAYRYGYCDNYPDPHVLEAAIRLAA
jgi:peroxiredoxin